jgi:hypothetical protein
MSAHMSTILRTPEVEGMVFLAHKNGTKRGKKARID